MAASALATQLAHLTDKQIKPSILSEPLKIFEDRSALGLDNPVVLGQSGSPVPRGRIWTNQTGLPANAYTFSYNPSSIGFATVWDPTIPFSSSDGALQSVDSIHPASPETISFDLLMNRIIEVSPSYQGVNALVFSVYGTICDLAVLYRTINGLSDAEIDQQLALAVPAVPATNMGFIRPAMCTVSFGNGDFNFSGFVTGLRITHAKFVNSMTPVLTQVSIDMTRTLGAGQATADGSSSAGGGGATATGSQAGTAMTSGGKTTGNKPTVPKPQPTPSPTPAPGA